MRAESSTTNITISFSRTCVGYCSVDFKVTEEKVAAAILFNTINPLSMLFSQSAAELTSHATLNPIVDGNNSYFLNS